MVCYNYVGQYSFFTVVIMMHVCAFGMYNNNNFVVLPIPDTPYYKKLTEKFGAPALANVLYSYQNNIYTRDHNNVDFHNWSAVANSIFGYQYAEERKRDFLVDVMLHTLNNKQGLDILHRVFCDKINGRIKPWKTPQGDVHSILLDSQYDTAMNVSEDIRNTIFAGKKNYNAFIVIPKSNSLFSKIKWPLYKGFALVSYLVSRCLEKEDRYKKKDEAKKNENPLTAFFLCADVLKESEEAIQAALEKQYPCLKTHEVKSLIEDRTSWLYNRNNWIAGVSVSCMALLLFCLLRDKLPTMHQVVALVVIV